MCEESLSLNAQSDAKRFAQELRSIFLALIIACTMCCTFMYFSATNILYPKSDS